MSLKLALIVAVACIAQGLALEIAPRPYPLCPEYKAPIGDSIPQDFDDIIVSFDNVRETISMEAADSYAKGNDPRVVIACFRQERENFIKLGKYIDQRMRKAAAELAKEIGDSSEKYIKFVREPMRIIAVTFKTVPQKVMNLIKQGEFTQAMELMKEARQLVEANARIIAQAVNELAKEIPQTAEKAKKMVQEIRDEARKGSEVIAQAIRKCIEEGGPKRPAGQADSDSESDESNES